jgi:hypothetical protein
MADGADELELAHGSWYALWRDPSHGPAIRTLIFGRLVSLFVPTIPKWKCLRNFV